MERPRSFDKNPLKIPSLARVQFEEWLNDLEQQDDLSQDLGLFGKYYYAITIHTAITEIMKGKLKRRLLREETLRSLLIKLDQSTTDEKEPLYEQDLLPFAAKFTAEIWHKDHPESTAAELISNQGLDAPLGSHISFLFEMYRDYLQKNKPKN